jgi:hypothetical protein
MLGGVAPQAQRIAAQRTIKRKERERDSRERDNMGQYYSRGCRSGRSP